MYYFQLKHEEGKFEPLTHTRCKEKRMICVLPFKKDSRQLLNFAPSSAIESRGLYVYSFEVAVS